MKLNLGCGPNPVEGWVNVDKSLGPLLARHQRGARLLHRAGILSGAQAEAKWGDVERVDITKRFPWPEQSAEAIYSSHTFEHLTRPELAAVLDRCRRVLKPGGVIRVVVPDLEGFAKLYMQDGDADRFIERLYLTAEHDGGLVRRLGLKLLHRHHMWMYDTRSLAAALEARGFSDVTPRSFRQGECPDLEALEPENPHSDYFELSAFVEARA